MGHDKPIGALEEHQRWACEWDQGIDGGRIRPDGKHPPKALIKKDIRGFRGSFTDEGRNVSERNGERCASEGNGTYL